MHCERRADLRLRAARNVILDDAPDDARDRLRVARTRSVLARLCGLGPRRADETGWHYHPRMRFLAAASFVCLTACQTIAPPRHPGDALWAALRPHCGQAFEGRLAEGTEPSDGQIAAERLVMHVRSCTDAEMRIPFHVGTNRSRTWVITKTADGVRLKHDHRHEDGTEDDVTRYGGDTRRGDADRSLDFYADAHTAAMLPASRTNIWTVAVVPGKTFTYALRREESGRRFRVEFDLTSPVAPPAAPW